MAPLSVSDDNKLLSSSVVARVRAFDIELMSNQILLTLSGSCLLQPLPRKSVKLELLDMPRFVAEELELRGLNLPVEMIRGQSSSMLEKLRDQADRVHCPCLILYQDEPLDFYGNVEGSTLVLTNLSRAAKMLGCSELAVRVNCPPESVVTVASSMKRALEAVQRYEVNLLIRPSVKPVDTPELLMELVKRIGGFHISAMPSFANAHATGGGIQTLRKLAPYSAAIEVSFAGSTKQGSTSGWNFDEYVSSLLNLGYLNKFSIDWCGTTNWVQGVQKAREQLLLLMDREDSVV